MNSKRIWTGLAVFVILLLAYAWIDGGREPLREISEPIELPGANS